jgi:hypothetical protein
VAKEVQTQESWLQTAWNWTYNNLILPPIEWTQQTIIQPFLQNVPPAARKVIAIASALSLTTLLALCVGSTPPPTPDANATRTSAFQTMAAGTAYAITLTPTLEPCSEGYCIGQTYYAGDLINLRNSPAGVLVGSLGCGDSVTIIGGFERKPLNGEDHLWTQVDSSIGLAGVWIAIDLFSPLDQEPVDCYVGNRTEEEGYIATDGDGFMALDLEGLRQAGGNIAEAFVLALGAGYTPEEAWNLIFRDTTVTFIDTGNNCHEIGLSLGYNNYYDCWAVAIEGGDVYVSTEFTDKPHDAEQVVKWGSHETGHEVDRLMTDDHGYVDGEFYGAYQMTQYQGGIHAVFCKIK